MKKIEPKLERLAKEIETQPNIDQLRTIVEHIRDDEYPRYKLVQEMRGAKLSFFANKLNIGYYDIKTK